MELIIHILPSQGGFLTLTISDATRFAPLHLMLGGVLRLPVDVMFKRDPVVVDHSSFIKTLMPLLPEAANTAQQLAVKEQKKQARGQDEKTKQKK